MSERQQVTVQVMDREYLLACSDDAEREDLHKAVELLNQQVSQLRQQGNVIGSERIAVMAALHLAHQILHCRREHDGYTSQVVSSVDRLTGKIDQALTVGNGDRTV